MVLPVIYDKVKTQMSTVGDDVFAIYLKNNNRILYEIKLKYLSLYLESNNTVTITQVIHTKCLLPKLLAGRLEL